MKIIGYKVNNDDPLVMLPAGFTVRNDKEVEYFEQNIEEAYQRNNEKVKIDAIIHWKQMELKIFEINWHKVSHKTWVAAQTNIEALKIYCLDAETDLMELDEEDTITEMPQKDWPTGIILNDNGLPQQTFAQFMDECKCPQIICSTEFNNMPHED